MASTDLRNDIIPILDEFSALMKKKGDIIRSRSYQKASISLSGLKHPITEVEQFKSVKHIGDAMYKKIVEYLNSGEISSLSRLRETIQTIPTPLFSNIYGIGPVKEKQLIASNVTTIRELRDRQDELLNNVQKIGLKYYEDILEKIPRSEIDEYKNIFNKSFQKVKKNNIDQFEIVGSYRRGLSQSGDIDVIITSKDKTIFPRFIEKLENFGIITEILSQGPTKCLVVSHLHKKAKARRIDFMYTTPQEYPFATLYFTGSKVFNVVMRAHASTKGYTMNEHGITTKDKIKLDHVFANEKSIFDFLGLKYKDPTQRIDGNSIEFVITNEIIHSTPVVSKHQDYSSIKKPDNVVTSKSNIQRIIKTFQKDGIAFLQNQNEAQLTELLKNTNICYRNSSPLISDNEYDIIQDYVKNTYPNNPISNVIGCSVKKNKVNLPYFMGSMDKIKPDTNALNKWTKKYAGPYVLSCKLDGVSGLFTTIGKQSKLYTRGDGSIGQDISHLIPYIENLPKINDIVVRGEFIINRNVFQDKYSNIFANPRNMVSGILNSKTVDKRISDVHFVAYEIIEPKLEPSKQFNFLLENKFTTALHLIQTDITNELLSSYLIDWRKNYSYDTDGVIVTDDNIYPRKHGNPEHSFAFKMVLSDQIAESKVVDVIWNVSKSGYIKPKVRIEPVHLGGVKIEYATGFNGLFIESNKIGVGAVVEIIRSGDVIPYIKNVITPASHVKMPSIPYIWNDTNVDIMVENVEQDMAVLAKRVETFFTGLKIQGLSSGNLKKIHNIGFVTIGDIMAMKPTDFKKAGFVNTYDKMYDNIHNSVDNASLVDIMALSTRFGRGLGKKKIQLIIDSYPNIIHTRETNDVKIKKLEKINGIGKENAKSFVNNINSFKQFVQNNRLDKVLLSTYPDNINKTGSRDTDIDTTHVFYDKNIVMTKIRDEQVANKIKDHGGYIVDNVNKKVWLVIVKSKNDNSNKIKKAKELNVPIITLDEFISKYIS